MSWPRRDGRLVKNDDKRMVYFGLGLGQSSLLFARSYSNWQNVRSVLQCNSAITGFPVPSCHSADNYILMHILLHFAVSGEWGISTSWGLFFVPSLTSIGHISILCMIKKVSKKYLSYKIVIDSRILNSGTRRSVTQEYSCVTFWVSPVSTQWGPSHSYYLDPCILSPNRDTSPKKIHSCGMTGFIDIIG